MMKKIVGCVYRIWIEGSKSYIGVTTKTIKYRISQHIRNAFSLEQESYLYNAMRKYGLDKVKYEVIWSGEIDNETTLFDLERAYIVEYATLSPAGYNMTIGGDGVIHTPELKKRKQELAIIQHSDATKRQRWEDGINNYWTPERRAERAEDIKKRHSDPEYHAKWSATNKSKKRNEANIERASKCLMQYNDTKYGTKEERLLKKAQKKIDGMLRYEASVEARKRKTVCVTTGKEYPSIKEAAIAEGCNPSYVRAVVCGIQKMTKGKVFAYAD